MIYWFENVLIYYIYLLNSILVASSIELTSANYSAYETDEGVDVCVVVNVTAFERSFTVLLSSQDGTATSEDIMHMVCEPNFE